MEKITSFYFAIPFRLQVAVVAILFTCAYANPPMEFRSQDELGLYNANDKVCILTNLNFNETVLQQNRSVLVEFYNSYCGHCRRFAPFYKKLAEEIHSWRDVLPVCALDCAVADNNDYCREYEVMGYPSLRYFGPNFEAKLGHYGEPIETQDVDEIRTILAVLLAAENTTASMSAWPNLKNMTAVESSKPIEGLNSNYKLVIVVYEAENSTVGIETALRFQRWPAIQIRRVNHPDVALKMKINGKYKIASINRKGDIKPYEASAETVAAYAEVVESILKEQHFTERPETLTATQKPENQTIVQQNKKQLEAILDNVKRNKHMVYQADLEMAIRTVLFNEIPKNSDISGESLLALQRFLAVLKNYNPLGVNGRMVINKMQEFVVQFEERLSGREFASELQRMEELLSPIFSSNHYVGCASSQTGKRGYTCSLWQLFHFMSVQAANNNISQDPLEVLQAMHGYIKHYFGCSECSEHFQVAVVAILFTCAYANPPMEFRSQDELGLYNANDKVCILTNLNFNETVLQQNRSVLVQFYNSYCGHCRRFAPFYKKLAEDIHPWRDVLPVCALDCAVAENSDYCREYDVREYPSLRYFGPNFEAKEGHYGEPIGTRDIDEIRTILAVLLAAENTTASMSAWPNLKNMTAVEISKPLEGLNSNYKLVIVVYEAENSTVGIETALRFQRWPAIQIRRVNHPDVALKMKINGKYKIASINRKGDIKPYEASAETVAAYAEVIESILKEQHFTERPETTPTATQRPENQTNVEQNKKQLEAILDYVKRNKHMVYQADLEMAIRTVLFNEIPKNSDISGESLLALQRFLAVLKNYNPLGVNGRMVINKMQEFVVQFEERLSGREFASELQRMEELLSPIFSSNHYVGCASSQTGKRGYTCSLWQLFHFMSVQAANNNISQDPLEVLQAMHGYIKHYFGCSECSEHFQSMASRRKIWNVPNKDEAVLWIWAAHNEVNERLAGDTTEDPLFPKIQFPSRSSCEQCYKDPKQTSESLDKSWNKDAVLSFLKNIHNPEFISRYSVKREEVLSPSLEKLRSKRMVSNIFTDMDMRMGMLLYGFCILMMVVAFKLFAYKGYRKKPYCHDVLGKV